MEEFSDIFIYASFFYEYQMSYDRMIEGHWINIWFGIMCRNFEPVRESLSALERETMNLRELVYAVNEEYSEARWNELTNGQAFHKLNWRLSYNDKENTIYRHMKQMVFD